MNSVKEIKVKATAVIGILLMVIQGLTDSMLSATRVLMVTGCMKVKDKSCLWVWKGKDPTVYGNAVLISCYCSTWNIHKGLKISEINVIMCLTRFGDWVKLRL